MGPFLINYRKMLEETKMVRFFVTAEELQQQTPVLTGENAQHAKVLRLKADEQVLLCDGEGREALCTVSDFGKDFCNV